MIYDLTGDDFNSEKRVDINVFPVVWIRGSVFCWEL